MSMYASPIVQAGPRRAVTTPISVNFLQRKCACGGNPDVSGECEACRKNRLGLQAKLMVGQAGDAYEQEADWMADQVMAGPGGSGGPAQAPRLQRVPEAATPAMEAAHPNVDRVLAAPGQPLEIGLRAEMESRFGHDFSRVRVHSDTTAAGSARDVDAQAYTVGHHVVFGAGRFAPAAHEGRRLLAHELSHVIQQIGLQAPRVQRQPLTSGFPRGTNYRFDTYRITERDLSDPDIVARLARLSADQLRKYRDQVSDPAVRNYINNLLAGQKPIVLKPRDPVEDCLTDFASAERVSKIVGPQLDVFECYDALEKKAAKSMLTPEAGCIQCLNNSVKMDIGKAHKLCRDRLLSSCMEVTESRERFIRKQFERPLF